MSTDCFALHPSMKASALLPLASLACVHGPDRIFSSRGNAIVKTDSPCVKAVQLGFLP
jgi:hypothetical protein